MQRLESVQDVLKLAVSMEQMAFEFYRQLAGRTGNTAMQEFFNGLAGEEMIHKQRLEEMAGRGRPVVLEPLMQKGIEKYLKALPSAETLTFKEAVRIAVQKEHASMTLYTILSELAVDKEIQDMLVFLAQEEASHKQRFQEAYHRIKLHEN